MAILTYKNTDFLEILDLFAFEGDGVSVLPVAKVFDAVERAGDNVSGDTVSDEAFIVASIEAEIESGLGFALLMPFEDDEPYILSKKVRFAGVPAAEQILILEINNEPFPLFIEGSVTLWEIARWGAWALSVARDNILAAWHADIEKKYGYLFEDREIVIKF